MKIFLPIFTGLNTVAIEDPKAPPSADCGMLGVAQEIILSHPAHQFHIEAYSWDELPPNNICIKYRTERDAFAPDLIISQGHSFGAACLTFLVQWQTKWYPDDQKFNGIFYDRCHNPIFGDTPTQPMGNALAWGIHHYQHAGRPLGVSGTPLNSRQVEDIDVSHWDNPTLAHVSIFGWTGIIMDKMRVRARVLQEVARIIAKQESLLRVPPVEKDSAGGTGGTDTKYTAVSWVQA